MFILTTINTTESKITVHSYKEESEASEMLSFALKATKSLTNVEFVLVLYDDEKECVIEQYFID